MIYPKCKHKNNQVPAVRYDGYMVPCCHFGGGEFDEIKTLVGDKLEQMHILNNTIDEINCSEAYQLIEESFTKSPLTQCKRMCSDPVNYDENKSSSNAKFRIEKI